MNRPATKEEVRLGINCVPEFPNRKQRRAIIQAQPSSNNKMTRGKLSALKGKSQMKNGMIVYLNKLTTAKKLRKAI